MKTIAKKGHTIGLHTYSHDYEEIYTSLAAYMKDLKKVQDLVKRQKEIKKAKEETGDLEDIMFLMHDGSSNGATVKALPTIIEFLKDKGYQFKVIDETAPTFHHSVQN